jgi:hypothetical protein
VIGIWSLAAVLLTAAVVFGRGVFAQLPEEHLAFPLAFAGGAVLASLTDTLMPEAFEHGRPLNSTLERDSLENSRRVLDRLCLVLREGENVHLALLWLVATLQIEDC